MKGHLKKPFCVSGVNFNQIAVRTIKVIYIIHSRIKLNNSTKTVIIIMSTVCKLLTKIRNIPIANGR